MTKVQINVYHSPGAVTKWIANLQKPFGDCGFKEAEDSALRASGPGWGDTPGYTTLQISAFSFGSGLTGTEMTALYDALQFYMTAVGNV